MIETFLKFGESFSIAARAAHLSISLLPNEPFSFVLLSSSPSSLSSFRSMADFQSCFGAE
jgi:hypothetical protein